MKKLLFNTVSILCIALACGVVVGMAVFTLVITETPIAGVAGGLGGFAAMVPLWWLIERPYCRFQGWANA